MSIQMNRRPAVAGQFYPAEPDRLRESVRAYLNDATVTPAPDTVAALVVPHAGFMFSGPTAAHAYARAKGRTPNRIILLGCSHRYAITTASVYDTGAFLSPLGSFPIDEPFAHACARMLDSEPIEPHLHEHALEVQLPFLAEVFGTVPLVPVLFGGTTHPWHQEVGRKLAAMVEPSDLVVASTDLSHYLSEEAATHIDGESIEATLCGEWTAFTEGLNAQRYLMCGGTAVAVALAYAQERGATQRTLLDYRTSAQASGDSHRVVGYAAISMEYP